MRSMLYLKSSAVTVLLTGGANLRPGRMWKVYTLPPWVMPPLAAVGTSVAASPTSLVPGSPLCGA